MCSWERSFVMCWKPMATFMITWCIIPTRQRWYERISKIPKNWMGCSPGMMLIQKPIPTRTVGIINATKMGSHCPIHRCSIRNVSSRLCAAISHAIHQRWWKMCAACHAKSGYRLRKRWWRTPDGSALRLSVTRLVGPSNRRACRLSARPLFCNCCWVILGVQAAVSWRCVAMLRFKAQRMCQRSMICWQVTCHSPALC